jgi:hypothetical protein
MNFIGICFGAWVALAACATPAIDFTEAVARRGCSQEDAPALEVYLTRARFEGGAEPARPYIRLEVAGRDYTALLGKPVDLAPLSRAGRDPLKPLARAEYYGEGSTHQWLRGSITLQRVEPDRSVEGSYELKGVADHEWAGKFSAPWIASAGGCG